MPVPQTSFDELFEAYELAQAWTASIVGARQGRHQQYLKDLINIISCFEDPRQSARRLEELESRRDRDTLFNSLMEAYRLTSIWEGFRDYEGAGLKERLKAYLKGPDRHTEERLSARSHNPRDTGYELLLGAEFRKAGISTDLSHRCDLVLKFRENTIYVECKRPFRDPTIENLKRTLEDYQATDLVENGLGQLDTHIKSHDGRAFGFVACSIEKVVDPTFHVPRFKDESHLERQLNSELARFNTANLQTIRKKLPSGVMGLFTTLNTLVVVDPCNIPVYVNQHSAMPLMYEFEKRYKLMATIGQFVNHARSS